MGNFTKWSFFRNYILSKDRCVKDRGGEVSQTNTDIKMESCALLLVYDDTHEQSGHLCAVQPLIVEWWV